MQELASLLLGPDPNQYKLFQGPQNQVQWRLAGASHVRMRCESPETAWSGPFSESTAGEAVTVFCVQSLPCPAPPPVNFIPGQLIPSSHSWVCGSHSLPDDRWTREPKGPPSRREESTSHGRSPACPSLAGPGRGSPMPMPSPPMFPSPTFPSSLACQDPQGHRVLRAPQAPLSHLKFC